LDTIRCKVIHYSCRPVPPSGSRLSLDDLIRLTHVHPDLIGRFQDWGLIEPMQTEPDLCFSEKAVPRIRRILRLRKDLGINWAGIGVVMDLLDRIDSLEQEIVRLRNP